MNRLHYVYTSLMNRLHYVYISTNLINNKKYIGQRLCPVGKTPDKDSYFGSGILIIKAIKKYGSKKFSKEIIFETESQSEVDKKEIELIKKYDCLNNKDKWYNRDTGGQYNRSENHSQQMSHRMKKFYQDPNNIMKIQNATAKRFGFNNWSEYQEDRNIKECINNKIKLQNSKNRKLIAIEKNKKKKECEKLWKETPLFSESILITHNKSKMVMFDPEIKKKQVDNRNKAVIKKLRNLNNPLYDFLLDNNLYPFKENIVNINILSRYRSGTYKTGEGLRCGLEKLRTELLNKHSLILDIDNLINSYTGKAV